MRVRTEDAKDQAARSRGDGCRRLSLLPSVHQGSGPQVGVQLRPRCSPWKRHSLRVKSARGNRGVGPAHPWAAGPQLCLFIPESLRTQHSPLATVHILIIIRPPLLGCPALDVNDHSSQAAGASQAGAKRSLSACPAEQMAQESQAWMQPCRLGAAFHGPCTGPDRTGGAATPSKQDATQVPGHMLQAVGPERPVGLGPPALRLGHPSGQPGNHSHSHTVPCAQVKRGFSGTRGKKVGS